MKKILSCILVILILFGCSKEEIDFSSDFSIETYRADMSGYKGLTSVNHNFLGTTVKELERTLEEKGYGAFVLSRTGCSHCQLCMQYINQAAQELGVFVYYIDAESDTYPIVGTENYEILDIALKPIEEKVDGEITLQTPHFFTVINGKFIDSYVGVKFKDDENPTESEIASLVEKYKNALKAFAK